MDMISKTLMRTHLPLLTSLQLMYREVIQKGRFTDVKHTIIRTNTGDEYVSDGSGTNVPNFRIPGIPVSYSNKQASETHRNLE